MKATRSLIAGTVAALLPFAGAVAQTPTTPPSDPPTQQGAQEGATFESLDTNSDGKISKQEAAANASVTEQFASYDQNGDGFIERAEVSSSNKAEPADPGKR